MLSATAKAAGVSLKAMLPLFEAVPGRSSVGVEIVACVAWALRVDLQWLLWGMGVDLEWLIWGLGTGPAGWCKRKPHHK